MESPAANVCISAAARDLEAPLLRYATRLLGDPDQARDVVQDTFLKLHQACQTDAELLDRPRPWLYRVCRNRALDLRRRRRPQCSIEEVEVPVESRGFDRRAAGEVVELFDKLPDKQRKVLELRFGEDRSYRSIGEETGISTGQVGFLIHEGIGNLRRWLGVASLVLVIGGGLAAYRAMSSDTQSDHAIAPDPASAPNERAAEASGEPASTPAPSPPRRLRVTSSVASPAASAAASAEPAPARQEKTAAKRIGVGAPATASAPPTPQATASAPSTSASAHAPGPSVRVPSSSLHAPQPPDTSGAGPAPRVAE